MKLELNPDTQPWFIDKHTNNFTMEYKLDTSNLEEQQHLISVIVPIYNVEKNVEKIWSEISRRLN